MSGPSAAPKPMRRDAPAAALMATLMATLARLAPDDLLRRLAGGTEGLTDAEAAARLSRVGPNQVAREHEHGMLREFAGRVKNPLNALLLSLAAVSWITGDARAAIIICLMVALSVILAFVQEHRSNHAAARLRAMVRTSATVTRRPASSPPRIIEIPIEALVPGDVVHLSAGDLVPADLRLLASKNLHVNQAALTGEAMPVDKLDQVPPATADDPFAFANICFMGTSVISGSATAIVLQTGAATFFGQLAGDVVGQRMPTSFDRGITRFTWLMIRFIVVMVPAVFLINGLTKGDWLEALLFALAVAVGLTPEMLPMIVTVNLARGGMAMARKQVIVKRLNAIQNFGAMDILCTDKTGTLTQDRVILEYHLDFEGEESERVLEYAYLNSFHQSGLKSLLDEAVLAHENRPEHVGHIAAYTKVDEIPFDFQRRRMSVVLARPDSAHLMITKGAVEEVLAVCDRYSLGERSGALSATLLGDAKREMARLNAEGFRVVGVAFKEFPAPLATYQEAEEAGMTLLGYIAFLDPPKETVADAIRTLNDYGVTVKILTGDNDLVTRTICRQVGLAVDRIVLGHELDGMSDEALAILCESVAVFAKLLPAQKARVIEALHRRGHVVGFLGDGINDGPALKAADVGISVDTAVDIAKESADIILLEKSLSVLGDGVIEGRKVFGNIVKYIKMGASSNFGNMFSVLGASIFLPFLPMAPIQVLTNNLLYDISQTTIPTDLVDEEYLRVPRQWDIGNLTRFVLIIGPLSSIFDYLTYFMMLYVFHAWDRPALFQAGWFVESLLTQTLIIHIIRTARIPFVESRASMPLIATTIMVVVAGAAIPSTFIGHALGFVALPPLYWPLVATMMLGYAVLTHLVKIWFVRRWGM
ncbi:MAG: magnesium-translocating P-type ATPase [Rhodospirillales bacterium]|nr:magnesium-translocating P-type ATPase [Rhodospirillales bacterium]MDE2575173.1 magnesium-translocating P-type ATPase [Rhodospirillales bacterium]